MGNYGTSYGTIWRYSPFLNANADIGPSLRTKLLEILNNHSSLSQLKIELAAVVDIGEQFVKATYNLDGDGA